MRLLPVLAAALLFALPALARAEDESKPVKEADVPKVVVDALQKKYPGAKVSSWATEEEDKKLTYEAKLQVAGKDKAGKETTRKLEVSLTPEGKIVSEEERISADAVPDAVKKALADSKYGKGTVKHWDRWVENEKADAPKYEVRVEMDGKKYDITLDSAGKIVEEEEAEDEKPEEPAMK